MTIERGSGRRQLALLAVLFAAGALLQTSILHSAAEFASEPAPESPAGFDYAPQADPMAPIAVGPRASVGTDTAGEKVAKGVMGGLLGGVLGGSGDGNRASDRPDTKRDPTRKLDFVPIETKAERLETAARAQWTEDGLLISARVDESPDKGTFQAVFLQTCDGRRLYPARYEIYKLWGESSVSVSWSQTSTVDGEVVSHEGGGWSDQWSHNLDAAMTAADIGHARQPATWHQLGFNRAFGGARQLGAYFNLSPAELSELGETSLFVHTTLPAHEPVSTAPSHWLIRPADDGQVQVLPADQAFTSGNAPGAKTPGWWGHCDDVSPLLLASAASLPLAAAQSSSARIAVLVKTGYEAPPGVELTAVASTGRTTGHIATLTVTNNTDEPVELAPGPFYIPSSGVYQGYVGAPAPGHVVPPGATQSVPVEGYCSDVRKPPVPEGEPMPPPEEWISPTGAGGPIVVPPRDGAAAPGRATIPGTDTAVPRAVDPSLEPLVAAPLLFAAIREIERATAELQESGELQTPFATNPEREREAVSQQTFWLFVAELENRPYTQEEFTERLESQYQERTGVPITAAPKEDQQQLEEGANDFWSAFELVGAEAKVISSPGATTAAGPAPVADTGAKAAGEPPPAETVAGDCTPKEDMNHTPKTVDVRSADSYGNEEERQKISQGIKDSVEKAESAYATSTPPATAYAIWGHDHIGGISSGYAKTVFLEANDQEWVWETEPLSTGANGTGVHTLAFEHGPECKAVVAGAALMWVKASSEAFDPLAKNIEVFRALDAVKEVTVKYLAGKLPPGIDDAVEAGVEAITDPSSDTYAAATGSATIVVGDERDAQTSENRVVYKREGKEDKAIVGGGETVKKLFASDAKPDSLTSRLEATARLEAGAAGNGFAKSYLESLYGTILVGVCECPEGTTYKVITDNGQFIRSAAITEAVKRAKKEMQQAAVRIGEDIHSGAQDISGDALQRRAEAELARWAGSIGGNRFEQKEAND